MGRFICVYSTKSMTAIASRKLIQIQAAMRRKRVESFGECMSKSYHEEPYMAYVYRHDFHTLSMTGVMGLCVKW